MAANLGLVAFAFSRVAGSSSATPSPADLARPGWRCWTLFEDSIAALHAFDPRDVDAAVEKAQR